MTHLTIFIRERGHLLRYDSLVGVFYCDKARKVFHEDDGHTLSQCAKEDGGKRQ